MSSTDTFAPGNVVVVRDEDWLVTSVDESADGPVLNAQGLSDLVRGQGLVRDWLTVRICLAIGRTRSRLDVLTFAEPKPSRLCSCKLHVC